jgi:hypothetical protein
VHPGYLDEKSMVEEKSPSRFSVPQLNPNCSETFANLKAIAKTFQRQSDLPYQLLHCYGELETAARQVDFVAEAVAMDRIYQSYRAPMDLSVCHLVIPRPVPGLISKRVLVWIT